MTSSNWPPVRAHPRLRHSKRFCVARTLLSEPLVFPNAGTVRPAFSSESLPQGRLFCWEQNRGAELSHLKLCFATDVGAGWPRDFRNRISLRLPHPSRFSKGGLTTDADELDVQPSQTCS